MRKEIELKFEVIPETSGNWEPRAFCGESH